MGKKEMINYVFFIAGRSGSGKSTVFNRLKEVSFPPCMKCTFLEEIKCRPERIAKASSSKREADGTFMSHEEFQKWKESDDCCIHTTYHTANGDWEYGLSSKVLETLDPDALCGEEFVHYRANVTFVTAGIDFFPALRAVIEQHNETVTDERDSIHLDMLYLHADTESIISRLIKRELSKKEPDFGELVRRYSSELGESTADVYVRKDVGDKYQNPNKRLYNFLEQYATIILRLEECLSNVLDGKYDSTGHSEDYGNLLCSVATRAVDQLLIQTGIMDKNDSHCDITVFLNSNDTVLDNLVYLIEKYVERIHMSKSIKNISNLFK